MSKRRTIGTKAEILRRTFGDLPVVDAKNDMRVSITRADERKGKPHDPSQCAIAQGCMREFGSSAAVIYKTVAYVDVLSEDGIRRVERFLLSEAARAVVAAFDRGEQIPTDGRWLVLSAPRLSKTLDANLRYQRQRRRKIKQGTYIPVNGSSTRREPRDLEVRSGSGHWQMIQRKKATA